MKKSKNPEPVTAVLKLPDLSQARGANDFTVLDDKVIIICDKSTARRLLQQSRDKGQLPQ